MPATQPHTQVHTHTHTNKQKGQVLRPKQTGEEAEMGLLVLMVMQRRKRRRKKKKRQTDQGWPGRQASKHVVSELERRPIPTSALTPPGRSGGNVTPLCRVIATHHFIMY